MRFVLMSLCLLMFSSMAYSADIEAGRLKSASCAACHGPAGISLNPDWPNIAGQKENYLVSQLKAFKSKERKSDFMLPIVRPLSDEDIADLAAYFSSL